jgi:hypothetical protein
MAMLETLLNISIADMINSLTRISIANDALVICLLFSGIGAAILAKFTGKIGEITIPVGFAVLFIGSFLANWALGGINIPVMVRQQELLVFTILGMSFSSFILLWFTGPEKT